MTARQLMTFDPACCAVDTPLNQVARMMLEHDCGQIPVTSDFGTVVGVVTDRDICCRSVAEDRTPSATKAGEVMSSPVISATPEATLEECILLMEENQIRRIPIVDEEGVCQGMLSQADIARNTEGRIEAVLKFVSVPTQSASRVQATPL